jgi:hypothetical protein
MSNNNIKCNTTLKAKSSVAKPMHDHFMNFTKEKHLNAKERTTREMNNLTTLKLVNELTMTTFDSFVGNPYSLHLVCNSHCKSSW